jgi:hypothetical protein
MSFAGAGFSFLGIGAGTGWVLDYLGDWVGSSQGCEHSEQSHHASLRLPTRLNEVDTVPELFELAGQFGLDLAGQLAGFVAQPFQRGLEIRPRLHPCRHKLGVDLLELRFQARDGCAERFMLDAADVERAFAAVTELMNLGRHRVL